ncbi:MAG: AtpZ/AtpI family protein [Acidimicrobiales bacterium]
MDDLKGRQELYNGFGDTMVRGIEFTVTLVVFAGIGYGLDRILGLVPVFTIAFFALGVVGLAARSYYEYQAKMQAIEAASPWAARTGAQRTVRRPLASRPGRQP